MTNERMLVDNLLTESRLYSSSKDYNELLDFIFRLRNFSPFNAMLLQMQKPGLSFAASANDWRIRFERRPKVSARPLLILQPFAPVMFVYDVQDTEGEPLPADVMNRFIATGEIDKKLIERFKHILQKKNIACHDVDGGDSGAGSIRKLSAESAELPARYQMTINMNHAPPVQFTTIAHELAHLFLGHLGHDKRLQVNARLQMPHAKVEIEAETVAYIVSRRNGVTPKSQAYLSGLVDASTCMTDFELYRVLQAAGRVEEILGLREKPKVPRSRKDQPSLFDGQEAGDTGEFRLQ